MRIALDSGGTFTDCVFVRDGKLQIIKVASRPDDPAQAIVKAVQQAVARASPGIETHDLVCGTTVGTNALLERRGGRVALVTTAGFEDVLEIGRQARPQLYDLLVKKAEPLVPQSRRFGLAERLDSDGRVLLSPGRREIARVVRAIARSGAKSVAVCLLFSFVNSKHERAITRALSAAGFQVSASHKILPEYREFERTSTTVVNAYLVPVVSGYLEEIERHAIAWSVRARKGHRRSARARVRVMQS